MRALAALLVVALGNVPCRAEADGLLARFGRGLLTRQLIDPDPAVRRAAAIEIGRRGDREAVPELALRLRTETQLDTRRAVLEAIGLAGDERSVPLLIDVALRPGEPARAEAIAALGAIADPRAVVPLASLLSDPRLEAPASRALARVGPVALPRLVTLLGDDLSAPGAARALGELGDARAVPALIAVLSAPSPARRAAAARALGVLGDPRVRKALAAVARQDPDAGVRAAASQAALRISPSRPTPAEVGASVEGQRTLARVTVLVDRGDERAKSELERLLRRSGPDRREALRALSLLAHPRHAMGVHVESAALQRACAARPRSLPMDCLFAVASAELDGARGWVIAALADADPAVRRQAALALGRIGPAQTLRARYADEADATVRAAILWALGERPEEESVPVALAALRREHDDALLEAVAMAGALADPRLAGPLLELTSDPDRLLRAASALSLGQIADHRAGAALRARVQTDPDALVRANAARALGMIDPSASMRALRVAAETDADEDVRAAAADAQDAGARRRRLSLPRGEDVFRARFVDGHGAPARDLAWVALLPDGRLRAGVSDALGEVVIFDVPRGTTRLWLR